VLALQACPASPDGIETRSCSGEAACSWGDDPRPGCRVRADCRDGTWHVLLPRCPPHAGNACPPQPAAGSACPQPEEICTAGNEQCSCRPAAPGSGAATWFCHRARSPESCPLPHPDLGTPCAAEGAECSYGDPADGTAAVRLCRDGRWVEPTTGRR